MNKSESIKELAAALAKAQATFNPIKRTEHVGYDTKGGAKNYNYAPLENIFEACRKALSENGLAVLQPTRIDEPGLVVETVLIHSSGEWIAGEICIELNNSNPQAQGSALTYARRYSLSAMLGVASEEDDDAQAATSKPQAKPQTNKEHWCAEHDTAFFKTEKMKSYGHPIKDAEGNQVIDEKGKSIWCHEHKEKAPAKAEKAEPAQPAEVPEFDGSHIANYGELWSRCKNYGMTKAEGLKLASIKDQFELTDLDEAWKTIFDNKFRANMGEDNIPY